MFADRAAEQVLVGLFKNIQTILPVFFDVAEESLEVFLEVFLVCVSRDLPEEFLGGWLGFISLAGLPEGCRLPHVTVLRHPALAPGALDLVADERHLGAGADVGGASVGSTDTVRS